jgi:hypothetical protein
VRRIEQEGTCWVEQRQVLLQLDWHGEFFQLKLLHVIDYISDVDVEELFYGLLWVFNSLLYIFQELFNLIDIDLI